MDDKKILILGNLISDKEIVFAVVLSEFKEVKPEFESSSNDYKDYQRKKLKNDNVGSGEFLEVYQYFLAFENKYPNDVKKAYQCAVVRRKIMNHHY